MGDWLTRFLEEEPKSIGSILFWIVLVGVLTHLWMIAVFTLIPLERRMMELDPNQGPEGVASLSIATIIFLSSREEVLHRTIPLMISKWFSLSLGSMFVIIAIASLHFGYLHTLVSDGRPPMPPMLQLSKAVDAAGFGVIASFLYLKCGGMNGKILKPTVCAALMHSSQNLVSLFINSLNN